MSNQKRYMNKLRKKCKLNGICTTCLVRKSLTNNVICTYCKNQNKQWRLVNKDKLRIKKQNQVKSGKCRNHKNNPIVPGTTMCIKCFKYLDKYRSQKSDKIKETNNIYYNKNEKSIQDWRHQWHKINRPNKHKYDKKYNRTPNGKLIRIVNSHKRRANLNNIIHDFTREEWKEKKAESHGICLKKYGGCGKQKKLTLDHVYPISKANEDYRRTGVKRVYIIDDIVPLCKSCNCIKHNKVLS